MGKVHAAVAAGSGVGAKKEVWRGWPTEGSAAVAEGVEEIEDVDGGVGGEGRELVAPDTERKNPELALGAPF